MKFGWLTLAHSPSPAQDARAIFEQLEQATLAEEVGFDGVWLTEHNFTGESVYADPIPFAAALAMRTQRIRIGFAVIQMALRHPVRLATQLSLPHGTGQPQWSPPGRRGIRCVRTRAAARRERVRGCGVRCHGPNGGRMLAGRPRDVSRLPVARNGIPRLRSCSAITAT